MNLYDMAVEHKNRKMATLLREKGARPTPKPDFSEIHISWGNSWSGNEHYMQNRVALVDRKFGFFAETGCDFRPIPRKVQVEQDEYLVHQYREQRIVWAHGAGKYFTLLKDESGMEYGFYAGLTGMLSFPRYRGISDHPPVSYDLVPSAGAFMKGNWAAIKVGTERYHFGTLHESAWKMNITLFVSFRTKHSYYDYKEIQY
jgi:hypothetical protein